MTTNLGNLENNLNKELQTIDAQLGEIATEKSGDFEARVEDLGDSMEDVAEEMASLDQRQAMVTKLKEQRKEIIRALEKIKDGTYGKCDSCSVEIKEKRLVAMPVAALCIDCAKNFR